MTDDAKKRKQRPIKSGVLDYFPEAISDVAYCSYIGNEQHNPGSELHWDRSKSGDELDALVRHLVDAGTVDTDGVRHSAKVAWRALANLQKEIEREAHEDWQERMIDNYEEDKLEEEDLVVGSVEWDLREIEREERMKVIGQNGNDGLHYGLPDVEDRLGDSDWTQDNTFNIKGAKITFDEI